VIHILGRFDLSLSFLFFVEIIKIQDTGSIISVDK